MNGITVGELKVLIDDSVETIVSKHVQLLAHGINKRFEGVDARFDKVDARFEENAIIQNEILNAIGEVHDNHERRITALEKQIAA